MPPGCAEPRFVAMPPSLEQRLATRQKPSRHPVGYQRWNRLLFLHWEIDPHEVQRTLPAGLHVDTHEDRAYVGIVPFYMERIRPAYLPPVPWLSWFLELNVRTYVHDDHGRPGVYFYSLDCNQPVAVQLARRFFHLPYFHAQMSAKIRDHHIHYTCRRSGSLATPGFEWLDAGEVKAAEPGSLEFFLVERYLLFTPRPDRRLLCGRVHHAPYQIGAASVFAHSTLPAEQAGLPMSGKMIQPLRAKAVDVSIYPVELND